MIFLADLKGSYDIRNEICEISLSEFLCSCGGYGISSKSVMNFLAVIAVKVEAVNL